MSSHFSALQRAEIAENASTPGSAKQRQAYFSALQRAEIAETLTDSSATPNACISVLFNEPKLLKSTGARVCAPRRTISVLFNEPKLLKRRARRGHRHSSKHFSALQRAEIAENTSPPDALCQRHNFSALQRAEIAEI